MELFRERMLNNKTHQEIRSVEKSITREQLKKKRLADLSSPKIRPPVVVTKDNFHMTSSSLNPIAPQSTSTFSGHA